MNLMEALIQLINRPFMKRLSLLILILTISVTTAWSQRLTITGTVVDATNNEPLIGATVAIEGTAEGVITDLDGRFVITLEAGSALAISYIGYTSYRVEISDQKDLLVALQPTVESLEGVVVVGYATQRRESVVGAITQVGSEDIVNTGVSNITQAISGKLSGVVTFMNSGRPGQDDAEILIRGRSSWVNSSPLVMVDGIERNFTDIDPNEIETISVLKDASATAVFGSRGANGVILVTTKRGRISKPRLNVSFTQGLKEATSIPGYVDAYNTLQHANIAMRNDGNFQALYSQDYMNKFRDGEQPYIYPDVDWINEMIRVGSSTTANINLRGGDTIRQILHFAWI